jgi:hypothetical protein
LVRPLIQIVPANPRDPQTRRAGLRYLVTSDEFSAELPTLLLGFKCEASLLGKFALIRTLVVWPEIPYLDIN